MFKYSLNDHLIGVPVQRAERQFVMIWSPNLSAKEEEGKSTQIVANSSHYLHFQEKK